MPTAASCVTVAAAGWQQVLQRDLGVCGWLPEFINGATVLATPPTWSAAEQHLSSVTVCAVRRRQPGDGGCGAIKSRLTARVH